MSELSGNRMRAARSQAGQASVELVAAIPVILAATLLLFQVLAVGYTAVLIDGAAESGAIAVAQGTSPEEAVSRALPDWAGDRVDVVERRGEVRVTVAAPCVVPGIDELIEVRSSASVAV